MDRIPFDEIKKAVDKYNKSDVFSDPSLSNQLKKSTLSSKNKKGNSSKKGGKNDSTSDSSSSSSPSGMSETTSPEFRQFEEENKLLVHSWYERACKFCGSIIRISPGKDQEAIIQDSIDTCKMNIQPADTFSFAVLGPFLYMILGLILSLTVFGGSLFFVAFFLLSGISIMIPLTKLPGILASTYRMKVSKDIVIAIFYIVTYMRQNSNLERAIEFAAAHVSGALGSELMKILWDVESEKYSNIKESLDAYLVRWSKTNAEFLEAMNLIESSLYESREENRVALLDKALDVILNETYEKMLHYSHDIQSPISTLHMMGVILPILGLVILPLMVSFMEGVMWYHISVIYNVIIPVVVYFVGKNILSKRPGGYGGSQMDENNPQLQKLKDERTILGMHVSPMVAALLVAIPLFLIGISPIIAHYAIGGEDNDIFFGRDELRGNPGMPLLDYREGVDASGNIIFRGPYSIIATLMGICIVLSLGLGVGVYYYVKTKGLVEIREKTKALEDEFGSAIFQLGNRLGDGFPLEMSFGKVVEVMPDSKPGQFFSIIDGNIRRLGMSPEQAIFDGKNGAILFFPSALILSTMKVLTESIKKGPEVAARAMMNVARYVKEMHAVEERLNDLMSEVLSSMRSLINFLAPVISGIVVGITAMITNIIGTLGKALGNLSGGAAEQAGALQGLTDMFGDGIPTYGFQIVVGLYIVQIIFIISQTINGISNGDDKLGEEHTISRNLIKGTLLYAILTFAVMVIFNTIAMSILGRAITADFV